MMVNKKKTKVMVFNPCKAWDFMPELTLDNQELEMVEEMRLLGVVITSDMKWSSNTEEMLIKAYKRLWCLRRLKGMGATLEDLVDVYKKQVRSVLELAVPAWNGALTQICRQDIERVQKMALHIMLRDSYGNYKNVLKIVSLESLDERRQKLCLKFAKKAVRHEKHSKWFVPNVRLANTRQEQDRFCPVYANHKRFDDSPISYLTKLLNSDSSK